MAKYRLIRGESFSSYEVGLEIRSVGIGNLNNDDINYQGFIDLEQLRLSKDIRYKDPLFDDGDCLDDFSKATIELLINMKLIEEIPFEPLILKLDTKEEIMSLLALLELDHDATMEAINDCLHIDSDCLDEDDKYDLYSATEDMYIVVKDHVEKS